MRRELSDGIWRRTRSDRREGLRLLTRELELELDALRATLRNRRLALAGLQEIRGLLEGRIAPKRDGHRKRSAAGIGIKPGNAELVLTVLRGLGGIQRADTIVQAIRRRHPSFGGASFRTQIYQILRTDARVERVGRGLYKAKPLR